MTNQNESNLFLTRRIGSTTYKVRVAFSDSGHDTMEDKILRIIKNESGYVGTECDMMVPPQMSRPA